MVIRSLLNIQPNRMWTSSSTWLIRHLLHIFAHISILPLIFLTFVGSIPESLCISVFLQVLVLSVYTANFSYAIIWGMLPMLFHCFDFPAGSPISSSLPLFCWFVPLFCRSRHTSLSLLMGVSASVLSNSVFRDHLIYSFCSHHCYWEEVRNVTSVTVVYPGCTVCNDVKNSWLDDKLPLAGF